MRPSVCVFALLSAIGIPALAQGTPQRSEPLPAAQPTTEDGIRAVLRGEYAAAARILRPLAGDFERPDPVAQFFLAILYEAGQGVERDQSRACGLFLRAGGRIHPFSAQAAAIAGFLQEQMGGPSLLCIAEERWQGGPPRSFALGPDHRVVFADTSITVTQGERDTRTIMIPSEGGFMSVHYTPLDVTQPARRRRHFFQFFHWTPEAGSNPPSWAVGWTLSEVVGDQWIAQTGETRLSVASGPPRADSPDLASLVRLQVNGRGEAEVAILGGPAPRTDVIPAGSGR